MSAVVEDHAQVAMDVQPLCPHIKPITTSARMDTNGCRLPLLLRGSGTSANISSPWQEDFLVMVHLKIVGFLR